MHNHVIRFVPDLRFQHPCSLLISGTTGAGKSHFVANLIEKRGIRGKIKHIYYFMPRLERLEITPPRGQELYRMTGLPTRSWLDETFKVPKKGKSLIVIDDQWSECVESKDVEYLLTYGRRHLGLSMCFLAQNFYEKSRKAITLR